MMMLAVKYPACNCSMPRRVMKLPLQTEQKREPVAYYPAVVEVRAAQIRAEQIRRGSP
jgi:hypothetical protein